jgi:4-hydroxy-3-polyprenylbenzoate decarboxylase
MRVVVGMTGATGAVFGVRLLDALAAIPEVETHLCISAWARRTIEHETELALDEVRARADHVYLPGDMGAKISSGSFLVDGMIIAPCSVRTLGMIAHGTPDNLIGRAADVTLKERRKLVLLVREAPLTEAHLANMLTVTRMGAVVLPPVPAFYNLPATIDDLVDHIVMRTLDQIGLHRDQSPRWDGRLLRSQLAATTPEAAP